MLLFVLASNLQAAQNKNAALISQTTSVVIKNHKLTRHSSYEICIYNREGEKYTDIEIPFSKMNKVSNIVAYIKTTNGEIIKKLSKSDISERSSFASYSFYEDLFVKEFTLKHNQYPYLVCYEYEESEDEFVYVDNWYPILDYDIPTIQATLSIEAPKDYKINFHSQFITDFSIDSLGNDFTYKWHAAYDGNLKQETFSPPLHNFLPYVAAVPENFRYEIEGSFKSWQSYGLWQYKLIKDISDLPDEEICKVGKLVQGMENRKQIVKILYNYLQDETRYLNISIKTGGLKPHPASYVAQNRYGDCKALSNYFIALLKSQNIESFYTKISAGETIDPINQSLPSQQSNHIIVCVPDGNDTLWVDATSDYPFNYVGTFIQNRKAFVITKNKSYITQIPALTSNDVLQERNISLQYNNDNETLADFSTTYRGKLYEILNQLGNSFNDNKKEEIIRDNIVEDRFEPIHINPVKVNRDSAKIKLEYTARSSEIYKQYGNDLIIKILPFNIPKLEAPDERELPLQINYPICKKDVLRYKIPDGYKVASALPKINTSSQYGKYSVSTILSDSEIIISKSFLLNNGNYTLEEYDSFYEFLQTVFNLENKTYITTTKKS